jgi:arylformamidase
VRARNAAKVHDVSLVLRPDLVTWPGEPGPRFDPLRRIADGDSANVSLVTFANHSGTHVDPPVHFIDGASTVDELPLDALVGPCRILEFREAGHVSGAWLEAAAVPPGTERILFKTRNSERWQDPTAPFTRDFAAIDASAARWCVDHGMKLIGVDYLSIEPQGPQKQGYPVHNTLLRANVVIVEGLDLRAVGQGDYELVCAPIKFHRGDGAPARVFLIER